MKALAIAVVFLAALPIHADPSAHCGKIIPKESAAGCINDPDGHGAHCFMGDIPPFSWGRCIEGQDNTFTCLRDGFISHYDISSARTWRIKADSCPALRDQLRYTGQSPMRSLPLASPKEEPKEPRT